MNRIGSLKMKANPLLEALRSGRATVGSWLSLCSPAAAELMAAVGWDWLVVDAEHSPIGFEALVNCFRAIQLGGAVPLARVPWNEPVWIQRALDAGALGLIVPMVNTAADAEAVVSNMKFATRGQRSFGGSRLSPYVEGDYRVWANDNLAVIALIETVQAVENAEAILSVEGVTGGFIGPVDLALSMGVSPAEMGPGTAHEAAIQAALAAAQKTGKAIGKYCFTAAEVNTRIVQGFQLLALFSDAGLLDQAAREALKEVKQDRQP